jgi:hypothetical protein
MYEHAVGEADCLRSRACETVITSCEFRVVPSPSGGIKRNGVVAAKMDGENLA